LIYKNKEKIDMIFVYIIFLRKGVYGSFENK